MILLSPHPDDLALSIGGILSLGLLNGYSAVTVFTESRYSPAAMIPPSEVSAARRAEDLRYFSSLGASVTHLGFPDTSMRGYISLKGDGRYIDPILHKVTSTLRELLKGQDLVVAPLGLGGHVDHETVRRGAELSGEPLILYEDLPYASDFDDNEIRLAASGYKPLLFDVTRVFGRKLDGLSAYRTQITRRDLNSVVRYARRLLPGGYGERLWVNYRSWEEISRRAWASALATFSQEE
ncbi:hypothetical protein HS1genome_1317 [Sulfodiicoccus acidiphilus]|uniref:PIG-L family deacetylase n=1 Tax=Sulfodiicoccus acidiphilus TaxID=1670455 RepID=A0A348B426_9CREN|nr:PIG-L family deacetylase [Sulfodiicoccus acidiphilus]BBD72928.1 hypothetical protein HS1genome_1317 [Sulfodiicoccus acidiphilus]GGT87933.1 hypothetical protein GCM10007116_02350 [Sulfodiicoccus acidiphilus]